MRRATLRSLAATAGLLGSCLLAPTAPAFPGVYVGKSGDRPVANVAHVVLARRGGATAVTVMPDYQGSLGPFVWIQPVPADVTLERARVLKREAVERVERLTAPRHHDFWEMAPCEAGEPQQEWERDLSVKGTGFLGEGAPAETSGRKVARELSLRMDPDFKEGEYSLTLLEGPAAEKVGEWLAKKGFEAAPDALAHLVRLVQGGQKLLVAEIDPARIELMGGDRAGLSPIRWVTATDVRSLPVTLGLHSLGKAQDLVVYVLDPKDRWEAKSYGNGFPPTDVEVDPEAKEKVAELYVAVHDLWLAKNPGKFLTEWSWSTKGCGEPCQNEALLPSELLTLGVDFFEQQVPKEEREPKPPPPTAEEEKGFEASLEGMKPAEKVKAKKAWEEERREVARRKALIARAEFVLTRLHYRYGKSDLPKDLELGPAEGHVTGGVSIPKGEAREVTPGVRPSAEPKLQTRFNGFHPTIVQPDCDAPKRGRWGKTPPERKILRKVWVADDLARRNRTLMQPAQAFRVPVPELGITPAAAPAPSATASAVPSAAPAKEGGGCTVGSSTPPPLTLLAAALAPLLLRRRRR